jgi:chorismate dehydratase
VTGEGVAPLRLGCVKYLNAQPLIHGWRGRVIFDHPAVLCGMLSDAELDVAFVSSFEFLRNPVYTIVDDIAVVANDAVYSVFVAHPGSLETVDEIALDPASQTSVNLLRCLLAERGLRPRLVADVPKPTAEDRTGARLLIGDQAIRYRAECGGDVHIWDLGAAWRELTALPFVFALWLIRPGVPRAEAIASELRDRRDENVSALDGVIADQKDFDPEFCRFYFGECLRFSFAAEEKRGLLTFRSLCQKHGILPPNDAPLRLI